MKKRDKAVTRIAVLLFTLLILFLVIHNFNSSTFFDASFSTCISLAIAVGISFLLSQRQTDTRKQKDILLALLTSLQNLVNDKEIYQIEETTKLEILTMRSREISNKLNILSKYSDAFDIGAEVNFLKEKLDEYENTIGDHFTDRDYLSKSSKELRRPLALMDMKIFETMLKIYS